MRVRYTKIENVKYEKIPLENRADRHAERKAGERRRGRRRGRRTGKKILFFHEFTMRIHQFLSFFCKMFFLALRYVKPSFFGGRTRSKKKTTSKRKITPIRRFLDVQKKGAKKDA